MLRVEGLESFYGSSQALFGMALSVGAGEVVTLLGRNGMGKTTTVRSIMGLLRPRRGRVVFEDSEITGRPAHRIALAGIGLVPEGRQIFPNLTLRENLVATARLADGRRAWTEERIYSLFPPLRERSASYGNQLSGGEQQMLAIARALMSRPRLLLLDEPSLGLAPMIVKQIFRVIDDIKTREGMTVLLVEQNAYHALRLADRGYVLANGRIVLKGTGKELLADEEVRKAYLEGG